MTNIWITSRIDDRLTASLSNETASSPTDQITADDILTGTGDTSAAPQRTVDGKAIEATATANGGGAWSAMPTGLLDGVHTDVTSETDTAGNAATAALTSILDTEAPAVTVRLSNDTGSSSTDYFTNDSALTGTGDPNALVHFVVDGIAISMTSTADNDGVWTFAAPGLADGYHVIVASETDAARNTATASLAFWLDTTPPFAQVGVANTGTSYGITSDPSISGQTNESPTLTHATSVNLTVDGIPAVYSGWASYTFWHVTLPGLADGEHTVVFNQTDLAGNSAVGSLTFTLDRTAPVVTAALAKDDGPSPADKITSDPTLTGTGDANTVVHFTVDGTAISAKTTADSHGVWSFKPTSLPNGPHTVIASETDAAGNTATASLTFQLDAAPLVHADAYVLLQGHSATTATSDSVVFNDVDITPLRVTLVSGPTHGTLQLADDGTFDYVPATAFTGVDQFEYSAINLGGASSNAHVLLHVVPLTGGGTLDLLALTPREQIAATYTAFFGRGADAGGFEFWVYQFAVGLGHQAPAALFANIASSFGVSEEAKGLYPFLVNPFGASDGQINAFLGSVYANLFNRSPDSPGLAYWTGQIKHTLAAGQFVGSVLVDIISGARNTEVGQDIMTLMGKTAVSLQYVHEQEQLGATWSAATDRASATSLLHDVTSDPNTVLVGISQAHDLILAGLD